MSCLSLSFCTMSACLQRSHNRMLCQLSSSNGLLCYFMLIPTADASHSAVKKWASYSRGCDLEAFGGVSTWSQISKALTGCAVFLASFPPHCRSQCTVPSACFTHEEQQRVTETTSDGPETPLWSGRGVPSCRLQAC